MAIVQIGKYQFHEIGDRIFRKVGDRVLLWDKHRFRYYGIPNIKGMEIIIEGEIAEIKYDLWGFQSSLLLNHSPITHVSIPRGDFPVAHLERLTVFPHDFVEGDELRIEDVRGDIHRVVALDGSTIICCRQGMIRIYCK